jgi:putative nucleotidyltransferase with HDIG domain
LTALVSNTRRLEAQDQMTASARRGVALMMKAVPPVLVNPLTPLLTVRSAALCTIAQLTAARLVGPLGDRWSHTVGVARCAAELADALGLDADDLVAAAWLHDIGYAPAAVITGFHPLDGARYLAEQLWPMRIAGLVAHHAAARFVATARGLDRALAAYPYERGPMSDALTYADQIVDMTGRRIRPGERRAEVSLPLGPDSWDAAVEHLRGPHLRAAVARIDQALIDARRGHRREKTSWRGDGQSSPDSTVAILGGSHPAPSPTSLRT